jgi:aminoglycoside phosphotransferase (APT) family kinase protein
MGQNGRMLMGIEQDAVEQWVRANVPDLHPPFEWTRLVGGHSNLTYRVVDTHGTVAVVRRPPLGELLPKAHDMNREFRIISALWGTGVPVARPYGYCADPSVTGAAFYVMGFVDGESLGGAADVGTWLPEAARRTVSESFADTMAALHLVDPIERGIGDLGRHDGYAARQLKAWYGSWVSSAHDAEFDDPRVHALHDYLQANVPSEGPVRLVHGDFGVHNCLVSPEGHITAVLDWEVATLGDPLSDLAYLLNMWVEPGEESFRDAGMTAQPGFLRRADLLARYSAKVGGVDEQRLQYFIALNHWRSACIVHGVYTRYKRGQKSSEGVDMQRFIERTRQSIELSEQAAARLRG